MEETATVTAPPVEATPFVFSPLQQWEVAFIYGFACTFNPHQDIASNFYVLPNFTPQEFEQEIQKESSDLIKSIICSSIGNILNRKNPIESFKISLQQLVTEKMKTFEIDLDVNPLSKQQNFNLLPIDVKLYLIRCMIEWQLQDSLAVKSILDHFYQAAARNQMNPMISYPIGIDSKKRNYWQFGESCWVWREKPQAKVAKCEFEAVCKNKQDLEALVESLNATNRAEKALINYITEELYELADQEEKKKFRKERAELRKLLPLPEISITTTQLRSRGTRNERVRYNYDDDDNMFEDNEDDDFEEEENDEEPEEQPTRRSARNKAASPPATIPTRWSSRLNNNSAMSIDNDDDIADMDTSPSASLMDTTSSQSSEMDIISDMDVISRPISAMEQ